MLYTGCRTVNHSQYGIIQRDLPTSTSQVVLKYSKIPPVNTFCGTGDVQAPDVRNIECRHFKKTLNSKDSQSCHAWCDLHHPCRTTAVNNLALKLPVFKPTTFTHSQSPLLSPGIQAGSAGQLPCSPTLFICL